MQRRKKIVTGSGETVTSEQTNNLSEDLFLCQQVQPGLLPGAI